MKNKGKNADWLGIIAVINLIIFIIVAIVIWVAPFIMEEEILFFEDTGEINLINIILGLGILLSGFTQYFLLKTVQDIYYKVEK